MLRLNYFAASLLFLLTLPLASWSYAQSDQEGEAYRTFIPEGLPHGAPEWMAQLLSPDGVDYNQVRAQWLEFRRANPQYQRKTPHTKPLIRFMQRWEEHYRAYADAKGIIRLPLGHDYKAEVSRINRIASREGSGLRAASLDGNKWQILAPLITYSHSTKKVTPWQANIHRLGVARSSPNTLYAGSETGMIFRTDDKGEHWRPCSPNHYFGGEVNSVEVSYQTSEKVVIGSGGYVWLTTDGGANWQDITPEKQHNELVRDVVFHPDNDKLILVGTSRGLYRTEDSGLTWRKVLQTQCYDIKFQYGAERIYALAGRPGSVAFYTSLDSGATFSRKDLGAPILAGRIGISYSELGRAYVYVWATEGRYLSHPEEFFIGRPLLFKSTDSGASFVMNREVADKLEHGDKNGGQGYYDLTCLASPHNPEWVFFGLMHTYFSPDGGRTVQNKGGYYGQFELHSDQQDMHIVGNDTWLSTDGGIIYSSDFFQNHAEPRIRGIYACEFWGFDQGWNEDVMVGGRFHNGNMAQMDSYDGISISLGGSEQATGHLLLSNPRKALFSDTENVIVPDDWKKDFVPFGNIGKYPYESSQFGIGLTFDPRYAKCFYNVQDGGNELRYLWKTIDDGESYTQLYTFEAPISSIGISRVNPDRMVVCTSLGLYQSVDGGKTFAKVTTAPEELSNIHDSFVAMHPRNEQEFWISCYNNQSVWRTKDAGLTWEEIGREAKFDHDLFRNDFFFRYIFLTGNEKNAAYAIVGAIRPYNAINLQLRSRIAYRDDTTKGWVDLSDGLPYGLSINKLLPFYKKGVLRLASSNGIWERPLVDPHFRPVAQPIILNSGTGEFATTNEVELDSYSIVNQEDAQWSWSFSPAPLHVSDPHARNPKIRIAPNTTYDVTLTVTTPQGSDTKTVKGMIIGKATVPPYTDPTNAQEVEMMAKDFVLRRHLIRQGEQIALSFGGLTRPIVLHIYDIQGREVMRSELSPRATSHLDTSKLPAGAYIYTAESVEIKKSGRLLIH